MPFPAVSLPTSFNPFTNPNTAGKIVNDPNNPTSLQSAYKLADTATTQQAGDYSGMMNNLNSLFKQYSNTTAPTAQSLRYTPQTFQYNPSANSTASMSNLASLSQTGGYSPSDIADIRERNISPIRSVYANMSREMDRNRALSGGYSPNFNASAIRLARSGSDQIDTAVRNTNADLAEKIAQNKIGTGEAYASAAGAENALRNEYGSKAVDTQNEASKYNAQIPLTLAQLQQSRTGGLTDILNSMRGLYGTTPALSALYGGQALNAAQLQQLINNQNNQTGLQTISTLLR